MPAGRSVLKIIKHTPHSRRLELGQTKTNLYLEFIVSCCGYFELELHRPSTVVYGIEPRLL